jgi:ferredoxin
MIINQKKCVACGNCVAVCPVSAIFVNTKSSRADININACVECGVCLRGMSKENLNPFLVRSIRKIAKLFRFRFEPEPDVCPTSAFEMEELKMPRLIRQIFSDPVVVHTSTGVKGRGTEEVKTNDVCSRVLAGEVGFTIELGRPGVGVRFSEIQEMTRALARLGISFEKNNPITHLMLNKSAGDLQVNILDEKILSAIVEIKTEIQNVEQILDTVNKVSKRINSVTVIGASTRCNAEGDDDFLSPLLTELSYSHCRAKTNMGLGRITNEFEHN